MIEVLRLSDKQVRAKLFARVREAERPLVVSGVRTGDFMRPVPEREPFASIERVAGGRVDQLVVADEGGVEGMWRDPLGDLADALFPEDRKQAYAAATGYLLLHRGRPLGMVKKHGKAADDAWFVQDALHRAGLGVPEPDPAKRPGQRRAGRAGRWEAASRSRPEPPPWERAPSSDRGRGSGARGGRARARVRDRAEELPVPEPPAKSPWEILGIAPGTPASEAKKAFRALISQYHPDKVSHLAPEFQQLAEQKTREILAAWESIERETGTG